jgi:hypothetical protein
MIFSLRVGVGNDLYIPGLAINGEAGCAVKALVHSGGIPARELVRSTR